MKYLDETTQTYKEISIKALDSMPIGSIIQFAGSVIPNGWMICDGRTLRVGLGSNQTYLGEYADLYKVIGTTYGYVEYPIPMVGAIDFKIPDLRGKVPIGQDGNDTDFEDLGNTGGDKTHKHTGGSHTHGLANGYACIGTGWDGSNILRQQTKGTITAGTRGMPNMPGYNNTSTSAYDASALGGSTDAGGVVDTTSSSSLQPYLVVNYIIKVKNTTPTMASVVNATNNSTEDSYSCGYINDLLNTIFPVGKTEIFYDNNDHSNYLGFTWERTAVGKTIVGIDTTQTEFDTIGETGGEKTHTLTVQEMPKHSHGIFYTDTGGYGSVARVNASGSQTPTTETGGSQAHNNLQPYEVFAIWRRTA